MNKYADITFKIKVRLLDYWLIDNYKLGSCYTLYALLEINDKLELVEREVE